MKILISAYACEPGKGSEPEVGLRAVLAAARLHEVWVLTRRNNIDQLRRYLTGHPGGERIHLVGIDGGRMALWCKRALGGIGIQWYYRRWQRLMAREAVELDRRVDFDVAHHATLAAFWATFGVASVVKPLVIGPVGGGVSPPPTMLTELGFRGLVTDGIRLMARRLFWLFPSSRRGLDRAAVIFVQNPETASRLGDTLPTRQLSNALSIELSELPVDSMARTKELLVVGRLIPMKGAVTAVRALRHVHDPAARLVFVGDGPDRGRILRLARSLGVEERVEASGSMPRSDLLKRVRSAGVLVHPALHEEASLAVAEALALGTPAVSYSHGGPTQVMKNWPSELWTTIEADRPERTARRLAEAIDLFLAAPPEVPEGLIPPTTDFGDALLDAYETAVHRSPQPRRSPKAKEHGVG